MRDTKIFSILMVIILGALTVVGSTSYGFDEIEVKPIKRSVQETRNCSEISRAQDGSGYIIDRNGKILMVSSRDLEAICAKGTRALSSAMQ